MPRVPSGSGSPGLGEQLLRSSLTESVSELSGSLSDFVDTALQIEDQLVETDEESQQAGATAGVETKVWRRCPTREGGLVWLAIGVLSIVSIYLTVSGDVGRLLDGVKQLDDRWGVLGAIVLILVYAICMVILVPGTILNVGAGFLYGTFKGYLVTICGCMLGAVLCFALGRGAMQSWVRDKVAENGRVARLCKLMGASHMTERETFTIVLVSRLPPVMPFALTNYAFSITDVSFPEFFFGTLLGVTPACILDAYIGSLFDTLSDIIGEDSVTSTAGTSGEDVESAQTFELVVGVVLTIFATTVLVVYGNRIYVRLQLQAEREEQRTAQDSSPKEQQEFEGSQPNQGTASQLSSTAVSRPTSPTAATLTQEHPAVAAAAGAAAAAAPEHLRSIGNEGSKVEMLPAPGYDKSPVRPVMSGME